MVQIEARISIGSAYVTDNPDREERANRCQAVLMADIKMAKSSGEFWVASVLSSLGWGAALTRDGLVRTDILAIRADNSRRMIGVRVKAATHTGREASW